MGCVNNARRRRRSVRGDGQPRVLALRRQRRPGRPSCQEVARQRSKVIGQRDKLAQLRKLKDEADLQRSQLEKLNERMNALQQESEAGQAGLTSLGSAVTPASPYFPNEIGRAHVNSSH